MGSEGPPAVSLHVTGFKKFHGVAENPTERIVNNLQQYLNKKGMFNGSTLCSCTVLETAGDGAVNTLYQLLQSALLPEVRPFSETNNGERIIWLHFGVNGGASKFAIECQAVNEATFRCPDEMGWQPQRVPIIPEDGGLSYARETSLPVAEIVQALVNKGHNVTLSNDAGRFVCNYAYYHSLRCADVWGFKSLFVHVPPFSKIDEEAQMQFVVSLLESKFNSSKVPPRICPESNVLQHFIRDFQKPCAHSKKCTTGNRSYLWLCIDVSQNIV